MGNEVNTNVEALYEIKNSLVRFQNRIQPLQNTMIQIFNTIDEELSDGIKRKMRQIEERKKRGLEEGRTDSFVCDICGVRMPLRIIGDNTSCRAEGCNGTMHRFYTDQGYTSAQRSNDREEIEQLKIVVNNYNRQKTDFQQLFLSFFTSEAGDVDRGVASLSGCIALLEQYLSINISFGTINEQEEVKKNLNASSTNSLERAKNETVDVPLMSDLTDALMSKIPQKRHKAIHTSYAKAPSYITNALNMNCDKLSYIRETKYVQDQYGNFILNKYGNRKKEPCHYSETKKYIAMHDEMTDAEYVDVFHHEIGHFIDDILNRPSTNSLFIDAFDTVAKHFDPNTLEGKKELNDMLDDAFSTGAAYDRNISDIISALTMNNSFVVKRFFDENVAFYSHGNDYWNRVNSNGSYAGMREKDSFANIFAIETGNYRISTNFAERWFPELIIALKQSVGG